MTQLDAYKYAFPVPSQKSFLLPNFPKTSSKISLAQAANSHTQPRSLQAKTPTITSRYCSHAYQRPHYRQVKSIQCQTQHQAAKSTSVHRLKQVVNFYSHAHQKLNTFSMENLAIECKLLKESEKQPSKRAAGARRSKCKRLLRHLGAGFVLPPHLWESYNEVMEEQESQRAPAPNATKTLKRALHYFAASYVLSPVWRQTYCDMCLDM